MTEKQMKFICEQAVEYSDHLLTEDEKNLLKESIDKAKTPDEVLLVLSAILLTK